MENMIDITLLKPHPLNTKIYGEENIQELADKIKQSGWISTLLINQNNVVISGHRRLKACLSLGIKEVPFERKEFKNEQEELERLLLENEYREKTTYQKMQEGKMWEEIYKAQAAERSKANLVQNSEVVNFPLREQGKTRDIVAEKISIGSGKTYDEAKKILNEIYTLKEQGNEKESEFLKTVLNESVNGAKNLLKTDLPKVDEELKDKVINKEITAKEAIKEIKKQAEFKEDNSVKSKKEEMKVCSKCGQEKSIHNFYEGKNQCIECCKSSRNPKDVYGNEIKIDEEKIKGMNIEAVIAGVKDTNKNISDIDGKSVAMELSCSIDMFVQNLGKYLEMEEQFEDMQDEDKRKVVDSITSIEEVISRIKGFLY